MTTFSYKRPHWLSLAGLLALALTLIFAGTVLAQSSHDDGLVIVSVDPDGPAAQAGIVRGDILLKIDDQELTTIADLVAHMGGIKPGDEVALAILHGDDEKTVQVTTADRNGQAYLGLMPFGGDDMPMVFHSFAPAKTGAEISEVTAGSPAEKAGLKPGDVIVAVDDQTLDADTDLASLIAAHKPGDKVTLQVEDASGEQRQVQVELGEHPDKKDAAFLGIRYTLPMPMMDMEMPFMDGAPDATAIPLEGVAIVRVFADSPARDAGLQIGDLITAIDGEKVASADDVQTRLSSHKPGDAVILTVQKVGEAETSEVEVKLAKHPKQKGKAYLGVELSDSSQAPQFRFGRRMFPGLPFDPDAQKDDRGKMFEEMRKFWQRFGEQFPRNGQGFHRNFPFDLRPNNLQDFLRQFRLRQQSPDASSDL